MKRIKSIFGVIQKRENASEEFEVLHVSYKGYTGEFISLEMKTCLGKHWYQLSIYDRESGAGITFSDVKLEDVELLD